MATDISRRSFLKATVATIGGVAAATVPAPKAYAAQDKQLATLFDIRKCIGCEACVEACQESNETKFPEPQKPFAKMYPTSRVPVVDWSDKRDMTDRLTPYNWVYIQTANVKHQGQDYELSLPRRCMHCVNPPCVNLCPFGAAEKRPDGIVRLHDDICLGGAKCKTACPWKIPQRQTGVGLYRDLMPEIAGNGVMYKCDRCYQLIDQGEVPACIDICPEKVQKIGPRGEIVAEAHAIAKEINGYIYGEHENGGTNTIYVSPVPFDVIDKEIISDTFKKPGKGSKRGQNKGLGRGYDKTMPHFRKVEDSMDAPNRWIAAVALAPVAGIAAAFSRYVKMAKDSSDDSNKG